ncbi:hypothetical protein OAA09_01225 [bacterium]|nr:hypothetical protein [bacterium]
MMTIGDLVKWIGFPGANPGGVVLTGPSVTGIIVEKWVMPASAGVYLYDVVWADGTLGNRLYPQCLQVVNKTNE